jgi:hypothetical protein
MVALARRLARTLFAMWRDQTDFQPERIRSKRSTPVVETAAGQGVAASM